MAIVVPIISTWNGAGTKAAITDIKATEGALNKTAAVGRGMTSVGRTMAIGLTIPIALMGKAAVNTAREFDISMRSIQVNAQATAGEMKLVEEAALKMGQDTIYSANQAADTFLELSKAGLPLVDILGEAGVETGALYSAMTLAATEGMDLAFAGKIMAQAMNAYNIDAANSIKVTDLLAAASIASTATVTDLAGGLKYVAGNASALGQPIEDTVTALAILNSTGLNATTAGTSFNQMLTGLISPTDAAAKKMKKLGIEVYDSSGEMLPMIDIIKSLEEATWDMTKPERAALMREFFNVRGARAANALLSKGSDEWERMYDESTQTGKALELTNARMEGMNGSLEQLRGSAETAALVLGRTLEPIIIVVADALKEALDWFVGLSPKTQEWIVKIGLLVGVVGPLLVVLGLMIGAVAAAAAGFATLAGPVGAIMLLVGLVGAAIGLFVSNAKRDFGRLKDFFKNLDAGKFFREDWERTKAFAIKSWNTIKDAAVKAFNAMKTAVLDAWDKMFSGVKRAMLWMKDSVVSGWNNIKDSIRNKSNEVITWMRGFPDRIKNAIGNLSRTLYYKGRELINGFISGLKSISIGGILSGIVGRLNPFSYAYVPSTSSAATTYNTNGKTPRTASSVGGVTIIINESVDARTTASRVKRAIEGYDAGQGRDPGAPLRRAW